MNKESFLSLIGESNLAQLHPDVRSAVLAVVEAGYAIKGKASEATVKDGDGHRAIVTAEDMSSQTLVIDLLLKDNPRTRVLCEEHSQHPAVLDKTNPRGILDFPIVQIVDPIDGSTAKHKRLGLYCVSAATMHKGIFVGSAVFAPSLYGGYLVVTYKDFALEVEAEARSVKVLRPTATPANKAVLLTGVDTQLFTPVVSILPRIVPNFLAKHDAPSGDLALTWLAAGRVDVVIQAPQKSWDWAGAFAACQATKKAFHFFRLKAGKVVPVPTYDYKAFCSASEHRLGFVAGQPDLAQKVYDLLPRSGWEKIDPDTASGSW